MTDYVGTFSRQLQTGKLAHLDDRGRVAMEDLCRAADTIGWAVEYLLYRESYADAMSEKHMLDKIERLTRNALWAANVLREGKPNAAD